MSSDVDPLIADIVRRIQKVDGVEAIALGGSVLRCVVQ